MGVYFYFFSFRGSELGNMAEFRVVKGVGACYRNCLSNSFEGI